AYAVLGQWSKSAADRAPGGIESLPVTELWFEAACLRLLAGDRKGYDSLRGKMLQRVKAAGVGITANHAFRLARTQALHPQGNGDAARAVSWGEQAVQDQPRCPWYLHALALARYRAGQFAEASQRSRESLAADPRWGGATLNWLVLAMAQTRLGHPDDGRLWMQKATQWRAKAVNGTTQDGAVYPPDLALSDWLEFQLLYREAETFLRNKNSVH